jgi:hypothetical protein
MKKVFLNSFTMAGCSNGKLCGYVRCCWQDKGIKPPQKELRGMVQMDDNNYFGTRVFQFKFI